MKVLINELFDRIKTLLRDYPELRDNYNELVYTIWVQDCGIREIQSDPSNILREFRHGQLSSSESIGRLKRMAEHDHPELRGKTYKERHSIREEEVRQEISTHNGHEGDLTYLLKGLTP